MYYSTGLTRAQIDDLCGRIRALDPTVDSVGGRPTALTVFHSVTVALIYLRRNIVQQYLAEQFGVSQPTISRTICRFVALIEAALAGYVPTAEDLDETIPALVDGTVAPCWSWKGHPELWSGKHGYTGHNIQVAADHTGRILWVSDPFAGSMHDSRALREAGFFGDPDPDTGEIDFPATHIADKGYIGLGLLCPIRKPAHRELADCERRFNKQVNSIRAAVERAIAELKTWRILHTDYRRPLDTFAQTLTAVTGLDFYRKSPF